jgi:hypothetical protein
MNQGETMKLYPITRRISALAIAFAATVLLSTLTGSAAADSPADSPVARPVPAIELGAETDDAHIYLAGAGARRGGGVSGIAGHNAAMALLEKS